MRTSIVQTAPGQRTGEQPERPLRQSIARVGVGTGDPYPTTTTLAGRLRCFGVGLLATALAGCPTGAASRHGEAPVRHLSVHLPSLEGLSGLALGPGGRLWSVAERERVLVEMQLHDDHLTLSRQIPLDGVPPGMETEALAWSDNDLFLGTERQQARAGDSILLVRVEGDRAVVTDRFELDYAPWGLAASANQGIEGLCAAGGYLGVAVESVVESQARRWAPLALLDPRHGLWRHYLVALTSGNGKISALTCRESGPILEFFAIERHFGVSRLIRFRLAPDGQGTPDPVPRLPSRLVLDLSPEIWPTTNLEGLAWVDDEWLLALSDNFSAGLRTQTQALMLEVAPAQ